MLSTTSDAHVTDAMFGGEQPFKIYEGVSASGVHTILHFEGRHMVIEKKQDMTAILEYVQTIRELNLGKPWGELRQVGYIPDLFYMPIMLEPDKALRKKRIVAFFKTYPAFCAYPAYLKG